METPEAPNLMLQEYIPGGSEMVWMFDGYFDSESRCLFGLTGKKIRQYPAYSGVTSLGVCVVNDDVTNQTKEFMKTIGYRGILDIGYKYDVSTRQYKLLDVNPRIGTTFRLFVDTAGMDVARALYLDLTGQPVVPGEARPGRKWVVENFDIVSSLRYLRDGNTNIGEWARSFRGVEEASWFARDDLAPFAMMWWRSFQVGLQPVAQGAIKSLLAALLSGTRGLWD
jgi:predicted ATP-grasp superfamily ATP-dependent carboligase